MNFVKFLLSQYFFLILYSLISRELLLGPLQKNTIFWKSMIRSFRWIEINCFNRFRFLAEVSTNLQKSTILGNLRTITQEGKKEIRQMTPFFHLLFELCLCDIHFCIWKLSKFVFMDTCKHTHIEESEKPSFNFSIELRIHAKMFRVISWSKVAGEGADYMEQAAQVKR